MRSINNAGLLHDVGKIGIPDTILRKPGRLTSDESEIVKQHVALGDSIVRSIADTDIIRAGIRHHHERWDGRGYLEGLSGDDIPLIARILAVGDVFSAMTTTRPYRKALPIEEALRRLGDAAGTQLDERLVAAFLRGIEEDPERPSGCRRRAAASVGAGHPGRVMRHLAGVDDTWRRRGLVRCCASRRRAPGPGDRDCGPVVGRDRPRCRMFRSGRAPYRSP